MEKATNKMMPQKKAWEIFEEVVALRNKSDSPFTDEMEKTFRAHSQVVAEDAALIASFIPAMDTQMAYVCGLLHDAGRLNDEYIVDENHHFHALTGYSFLKKRCPEYPQLAQTALLHEVLPNNKALLENFGYSEKDIEEVFSLSENMAYTDYDYLIILCDGTNNLGKNCTIEDRYRAIFKRRGLDFTRFKEKLEKLNAVKKRFDTLSGKDIYKILKIY